MRSKILIIFPTVLLNRTAFSQQHRYPVEDFYHRNITIPIDHIHGGEGTFTLYYELSKNFKFEQPTIIFVTDGQQHYGEAGKADELAEWMQFDSTFNLIFIENRGRQYSFVDAVNADSTVNWERVYRLLSSRQMVEDIECVRRDLFKEHPESKLFIFARLDGGYVRQE